MAGTTADTEGARDGGDGDCAAVVTAGALRQPQVTVDCGTASGSDGCAAKMKSDFPRKQKLAKVWAVIAACACARRAEASVWAFAVADKKKKKKKKMIMMMIK